jgi:uncharacterized protein (DUF849 family)
VEDADVFLQACVNGARRPGEHPALPVTPAALAEDVAAVVDAGADAVHLHVKDASGLDTLAPAPTARVLDAVRARIPGVAIGVTTGAWASPDPVARAAAVASWTVLPDLVSVNWHEAGAEDVARGLLERGVAVEAGLWDEAAVDAWLASSLQGRCTRVLVELPDGLDEQQACDRADRMVGRLRADAGRVPILLHGEGATAWPLLRHAYRRGLQARTGLEDVLDLPDGRPAPDNAALITAALQLIEADRSR